LVREELGPPPGDAAAETPADDHSEAADDTVPVEEGGDDGPGGKS
jgi:hypothetical protein